MLASAELTAFLPNRRSMVAVRTICGVTAKTGTRGSAPPFAGDAGAVAEGVAAAAPDEGAAALSPLVIVVLGEGPAAGAAPMPAWAPVESELELATPPSRCRPSTTPLTRTATATAEMM